MTVRITITSDNGEEYEEVQYEPRTGQFTDSTGDPVTYKGGGTMGDGVPTLLEIIQQAGQS